MSRKPSSGVGRGHGVRGLSKMTREDRIRVEYAQQGIREENETIPSFVKEGMSSTEIREEIVSRVRTSGESVAGVSPSILDNRFADAKDKRFAPLIDGLNATRSTGYSGYGDDEYYIGRARELASGYSTRELRSFVVDELGGKVYRGGRKEYETTIGLNLMRRFTGGVKDRAIRDYLGNPDWDYINDRVSTIQNAISRRRVYRSRIDEVRAKYRKAK
ncbi:MAG: hypothetical protein IJM68_04885 [Synergistaceae bacterium]|nr:hypothetical protein [Synergistaceae bacterium]